eukprot:GSMAST32.ASY1.ANO1.1447.1 assembled CDS
MYDEWIDIVKYMYNKEDSLSLTIKIKNAIQKRPNEKRKSIRGKRRNLSSDIQKENCLPFIQFLKILLDFQLDVRFHFFFFKKFDFFFFFFFFFGKKFFKKTKKKKKKKKNFK